MWYDFITLGSYRDREQTSPAAVPGYLRSTYNVAATSREGLAAIGSTFGGVDEEVSWPALFGLLRLRAASQHSLRPDCVAAHTIACARRTRTQGEGERVDHWARGRPPRRNPDPLRCRYRQGARRRREPSGDPNGHLWRGQQCQRPAQPQRS